MKQPLFFTALLFTLTLNLQAAEKPAGARAPAKAKTEDFSTYKTADALWMRIEELKAEPKVRPKSQAEMIAVVKEWFGGQQAAAAAFGKAFPKDERRYAAKLMALQASLQLAQIPGAEPTTKTSAEAVLKEIDAIIAAADAPAEAKGEATFIRTMMRTENLDPEKPESVVAFFQASDEFLAQHGTHKLAPQMRQIQLQIASRAKSPEAEALLKKFAEGGEPKLAEGGARNHRAADQDGVAQNEAARFAIHRGGRHGGGSGKAAREGGAGGLLGELVRTVHRGNAHRGGRLQKAAGQGL